MAMQEPALPDTFREEANSLASAALASITPRMVNRLGGVAESTIAALDLLTSPEIVNLLNTLQKASPVLTPLLGQIAEIGPGAGMDGLAERILRAVQSGAAEVGEPPRPISLREMIRLLRRDPAMAIALRFFLGFVRSMWSPTKGQ
ncbi:MAG: hypothetical protein M0Z91_04965 [Actinomycetota bacterium]|nr:hypothetical protein [Actinomycetota bacterium]